MPALITPFDSEHKINRSAVKALMDYQYNAGVKGFYVCGSTGEGPAISAESRMDMLEAAVEANRDRGVIIDHIGAPDFEDVPGLIRHAAETGADAISSLAPNFYFNYTDDEIVDYYRSICDITSLPLLVYATPLIKSGDIVGLIKRITELPNVIGLKFTRSSYYELSLIKQLHGGDINVINGPDEMLLCGLSMGADGGIGSTYNIMPDWFCSLYDAFTAGDINKAREYQYRINRVIDVLLRFGETGAVKSVKAALRLMGFDAGNAVYPAREYLPSEMDAFKKALNNAGFDKI